MKILQGEIQLNMEDNYTASTRVELLPPSPITGRDGCTFIYDGVELVNNFIVDAREVPFDINHKSELAPQGTDVPAVAWLKSIEFVDNKIYSNVAWNSWGEYRLEDKDYNSIRSKNPAILTNESEPRLFTRNKMRGL